MAAEQASGRRETGGNEHQPKEPRMVAQPSVDVIVKPGEPVLVSRPCVVQVDPCEDGRGKRYRVKFLFVSSEDVARAQAVRLAGAGSET